MLNYNIIIVLVLFSTNISFSQGKYDRLLESGKYKKALKKIDRKLSKDSLAIDVLYSKVQLYNARDFKEFDSELSYELVNDLERRYNYLSYEDQHGYGEDGITEKSIELLRKNVISKAYEDVTSYNDIEHYEYFLSFYSLMSAQVKRDIQGRIYDLAFEEVKKQNKVIYCICVF